MIPFRGMVEIFEFLAREELGGLVESKRMKS
jgi:hypothetical protein